jgi:diketogulonate reductase-like aldo/keto reductase
MFNEPNMTHALTTPIDNVSVPRMFYGTAWKEDRTAELTQLALNYGFRAIDTANQRKHYYEEGVGQGIAAFLQSQADPISTHSQSPSLNQRFDSPLFLQTKFTFQAGQDHRLPYDPKAAIGEQVKQSLAKSLQHLRAEKIDSLVLHGPMYRSGLSPEDWEAWRAMQELAEQGQVRFLGISNVSSSQLRLLIKDATIKPSFVQNRCFAVQGWDREIRQICREHGVTYQGFSLLTANRQIFADRQLRAFVQQYRCTAAQLIYSFALHQGMIVLTGTTNEDHLREAQQSFMLELDEACVAYLDGIGS